MQYVKHFVVIIAMFMTKDCTTYSYSFQLSEHQIFNVRKLLRCTFLSILAATLFTISATAQKSKIGVWYNYYGNNPIATRWSWWNEVQYRNYNMGGDLEQLLLRTGISYNLSENNNHLMFGYGFIYAEPYLTDGRKGHTKEHRIFQQFITRQNFSRFFIQHRYRIEERFLSDDFKMRFRYALILNVPLNKKTMEQGAFYLSFYDEIFMNAESPVFDRNRLYGALGFVINKNLKTEAGAMVQMLENRSRTQFNLSLFNTIPFYQ